MEQGAYKLTWAEDGTAKLEFVTVPEITAWAVDFIDGLTGETIWSADLSDESEARQREADRSNAFWDKVHFGCAECGQQGMRHHPSCSMASGLDRQAFDTWAEERGER